MSQFEQLANFKLCQKIGKMAAETFDMMQQIYCEETLTRSVVISGTDVFRKEERV